MGSNTFSRGLLFVIFVVILVVVKCHTLTPSIKSDALEFSGEFDSTHERTGKSIVSRQNHHQNQNRPHFIQNSFTGISTMSTMGLSSSGSSSSSGSGGNVFLSTTVQPVGSSRDPSPIHFPSNSLQNEELAKRNFSNNEQPTSRIQRNPQIPLDFLRKLSTVNNISYIFENYVSNVQLRNIKGQKYLFDLKGKPIDSSLQERMSQATGIKTISQSAVCKPELTTIEVPISSDPNIVTFPKCVRVERCGGCCLTEQLACEPTGLRRQVNIQVTKFVYSNDIEDQGNLKFLETELVTVEEHTQCNCNCRVKIEHCNSRQFYDSSDCMCICKNLEEQESCQNSRHKIWDSFTCECQCRNVKECNSGYFFDLNSCQCTPNSSRLRESRYGRRRRQDLRKNQQNHNREN